MFWFNMEWLSPLLLLINDKTVDVNYEDSFYFRAPDSLEKEHWTVDSNWSAEVFSTTAAPLLSPLASIMSSDPLSIASQTLPERGNLVEHAADEKDNAAVRTPAPEASERINDPPELAALVHHHGDKVCGVELVPVRKRKLHNVLTRMKGKWPRNRIRKTVWNYFMHF